MIGITGDSMSKLTGFNTVDALEIAKFEAMAEEWWDPNGKFKTLHMLNPTRLEYIIKQIATQFNRDLKNAKPFKGLRLLDIGCGGGLLSEPMACLGAEVVGADAAPRNISVAQIHAKKSGLDIDYRHTMAEALVDQGELFDVILNMEVIEHVAAPQALVNACQTLLKNEGMMICSTINRNLKSYSVAILGAERVMRWLPIGTHQWSKFIKPSELAEMINISGLELIDKRGCVFNPFLWRWSMSENNLSVNYVMTIIKS